MNSRFFFFSSATTTRPRKSQLLSLLRIQSACCLPARVGQIGHRKLAQLRSSSLSLSLHRKIVSRSLSSSQAIRRKLNKFHAFKLRTLNSNEAKRPNLASLSLSLSLSLIIPISSSGNPISRLFT